MKETAIYLDPEKFFKGEIPPPPTPVKKAKNNDIPPPPPPKVQLNKNGEEEIFRVVEQMPEYPGSYIALGKYLSEMQTKLAKAKSINGKAKVGFTIDRNGKATDIKILEKDNDVAAKGAATIAMNMEKWILRLQRGKAVPVSFILPVEF